MIYPLFLIPFTALLTICSVGWYRKTNPEALQKSTLGSSSSAMLMTLVSLFVSLIYSSWLWKAYPEFTQEGLAVYPANSWFELYHNLSLPFIILSTAVLIVALLTAWYTSVDKFIFGALLLISEICLVGSFGCTNLFMFLLFFEASALPIFILIVYCGSPRRERLKAGYYFLFFTLYGSLSLLLLILNTYALSQAAFLEEYSASYTGWILLFIAFAVKIPLFPFHIWLPYAHVEASTSASIVLAALMLKLGGYGLIRFMLPLFNVEVHMYFRPLALFISICGILYGGLCAVRQLDLKRQIAFSSVSHMSFASAGIFTFTEVGIKGATYLMLSHGLTSSALFYLVGVLSDRYHTRSSMAFGGLMGVMPVFAFFMIVASLANVGFPGTSGFLPELYVVAAVVNSLPHALFPVLLGMFFTTAATMLALLRLLFGHVKVYYSSATFTDVTRIEFFVLAALSTWMIGMGLFDVLSNVA